MKLQFYNECKVSAGFTGVGIDLSPKLVIITY